jgi:2-oxo-3-hexenedioate decarboxylase
MEKAKLEYWGGVLNTSRLQAKPIAQITKTDPLTRPEAYEIQEFQQTLRLKSGETQVGWKMGLTSEAKRRQMNLDSPLYGFLTQQMQIADQGTFQLAGSIHPKIEPEIAFLIGKDLKGRVTRNDVLHACTGVAAAMEILDSRYEQFKYFSMEDVIADNSSSSHFVVGPWEKHFKKIDLLNLKMQMSLDGRIAQTGVSGDISGDPVLSVIQLCELLSLRDRYLKAGQIVLAGAATVAEMLKPGMKIDLKVDSLPSVSVQVKGS